MAARFFIIQKRERVARRVVFVGMFGVFTFGMLPDLFLLFLEARAFLLKTALVVAILVLIWRAMQKTFFKWLVSKWFFFTYFSLGVVHLIIFPWVVSPGAWGQSVVVTIALMTGSDPYSMKEILQSHLFLWSVAWIIHVASWLLIPALIAIVMTDAKEDIKKGQSLRRRLRAWLLASGVPRHKLDEATDEQLRIIGIWADTKERKKGGAA